MTLPLVACVPTEEGDPSTSDRDQAIQELERQAGAPIALEVSRAGDVRVLAMTPGFAVPGHTSDPAAAAMDFLIAHHAAFQLDATDASEFVVTRVDRDRAGDLRHVTLNRVFHGIPVFQGAITVHLDGGNNVFRALGNPAYRIAPPTNRSVLGPAAAAVAAGRALGVEVSPVLTASDGQRAVFTSTGMRDPIHVDRAVFHVAPGDDRFAYQAILSWLDGQKQQRYELALIDAESGAMLGRYSLVNTFTGRVFNADAQPTANMTSDTRTVASFDGDPAASPSGWVGPGRTTVGNNAVACTDLDGNDACGSTELRPTADASDSFDFPFDPLQNATSFKAAAVANAFYLVNDFHDRTYRLGFTETARNFQTSNFDKGGAQNDEVQVDVQDGFGLNNANFATPPDGVRPRMQMFVFTFNGGPEEDGDFDPTVIYHENTHGLSNRLVGGGSTACLFGVQSGGMGEGWSDFMAASFLDNPIIGAYVTANPLGIRRFSMANSPLTYSDIQNGTLAEVHDIGELWAAVLWDLRNGIDGVGGLGAAVTEQLVVTGMKLTPCLPTMMDARLALLSADLGINDGVNRCTIQAAFARRQMGEGASSPDHDSTTEIITSTAVGVECGGDGGGGDGGGGGGGGGDVAVTRDFISTDVPKSIPDNFAAGVSSVIDVPSGFPDQLKITVDINIRHRQRGDLVIQVISPSGEAIVLSRRVSGRDFVATDLDISSAFTSTASPSGRWRLFVQDLARRTTGTINSFALHITSSN